MENFKSYLLLLLITMTLFFPPLLYAVMSGFHYVSFFKVTQDVVDVVQHEGGITSNVMNYIDYLEDKGFEIHFKDLNTGHVVTGKVNAGTTMLVEYNYVYKTGTKVNKLETQNTVFIKRR